MKRIFLYAAAGVVVVATIVLALVLFHEPTAKNYLALAGLVVAELYLFGLVFYASAVKEGDSNNFLPAIVAAVPALLVSVVVVATDLNRIVIAVLEIVAWAIALVGLFLSLAHNKDEAEKASQVPDNPFGITPGRR